MEKNGPVTLLKEEIRQLKQEISDLRLTSEIYFETLNSSVDAIVRYDAQGLVEYLNPAFTKLFGWTFEELKGKRVDFVPKEAIKETQEAIRRIKAGEEITNFPTQRLTKDGRILEVAMSVASIYDDDGLNIGNAVIIRDETERKKAELRKLESIGTLAGGLAHDFNNLLSVILGNVSIAELEAKDDINILKHLYCAEHACLQAGELAKQLITFSRGGTPNKQEGSIKFLVQQAGSLFSETKNIEWQFDLPDDLFLLEYDDTQMKQAINNILRNAVDAMPDGGKIIIRAENIVAGENSEHRHAALSKGRYVMIIIQDQGKGINPNHLEKIFDPYFTTKGMGIQRGVGLGLTIAYSIIHNHGGRITVKPVKPSGTIVTLYLPALESAGSWSAAEKMEQAVQDTVIVKKILLMDDEEMIRSLGKRLLEKLGYQAETASDGTMAIQLYKEAALADDPFDLVILDLTVKGGLGGLKTLKTLQQINPDVIAIVSSGYSSDPVITGFKTYGFKMALPKPYSSRSMQEAIIRSAKRTA
ncbi:MAG: PAS domain S-box protein [Proteobacteria bacterium]|nr:PAS domain S-box protein [Pseudomonadota bacterium]MBU1584697.1 PAS domain S-box protein [Pseudomonadota bacterium]MBU2453651.1 PAS domain S-box protein [Pseudomonadota bacterium]MBU2629818.1 PAS domain S-box protein [Pseudomonadota bacterium]